MSVAKFRCEHAFDAPVERVLAMYLDAAYIPAKYERMGLREVNRVHHHSDAQQHEVTYRFLEQASIAIPAMAKKFMGDSDWFPVEQTERWHRESRTGEIVVEIASFKKVVSIQSQMQLVSTAQGCVNQMIWQVTCSVPLIGGSLAKFLADDVQRKTQRDGEVARELLATQYTL